MKKFPKISHITDARTDIFVNDTDTIYVLEKIDGANFRWKHHAGGNILAGSRNVEFTQGDDPLPLEETNKQFRHTIEYIESQINIDALETVIEEYGELVFFGESLHTHTVEYEWEGKHPNIHSSTPNYLGFDIWSVAEETWLSHKDVQEIHMEIGLQTVPIIHRTTVQDFDDEHLEIPKSKYRTENESEEDTFNKKGLAEGIVIKNDSLKTRAKKVASYMQEVQQHGQPREEESLEEMKTRKRNAKKFVTTFVTEQRVLKNAHKLVDEGEYDELQMPMMKDLPQKVLTDILTEEGWNIINHEYGIELTEESKESIRQLASDKCSQVLKNEIYSRVSTR